MSSSDVTVQTTAATTTSLDTGLRDLVAAPGPSHDGGPLQPGQTFGPRYHIIRLLGAGGMGAVYHAWDTELGVSVAIKVIRPEIMANPSAGADVERRFKRELLLARQVTHKNVVRIHDLGEIERIKYITMSYVNGVDLATRLKDAGRLKVAEVVPLARAIASGLIAAHSAGVVHRDLKPANIMIGVNGDTLIMDFGIARSSGAAPAEAAAVAAALPEHLQNAAATMADTAQATTLAPTSFNTMARTAAPATSITSSAAEGIVGTVQYMAPEQASGLPVDQRADIYAFGLILYDSLVGVSTIDGHSSRHQTPDGPVAELRTRMQQAPPSVRTIVPEVPDAFDRVITRCLDPQPEKRFQTTAELEAELATLDDQGEPIPIKRVFGVRSLAAIVLVAAGLVGGGWWYARSLIPPPAHDPVSVVIADFRNATGDSTFDRTVEPMIKRALEGASFVSAFDHNGAQATFGRLPPTLDETAARELAVKQGLGIVLAGSIEPQGTGYTVSMKAVQTVTGAVVLETKARAASKPDVLAVTTRLVADVRKALGDEVTESAQLFANQNLSATSLEVVQLYAASQEAASNGKYEEAREIALKAVALDPKFGVGYQLAAVASRNLGNMQDAAKYVKLAIQFLDGMTERERYSTRGFSFRVSGDWTQCVREYGELVSRFSTDITGHNQRALCQTKLKNMKGAVAEMQQVVKLLPRRSTFRNNLALYANYAGDFDLGEKEARAIPEPGVYVSIALAQAQTGKGRVDDARATYMQLATLPGGASFATSGLGDLAMYEGRYSDAARFFDLGARDDMAAKNLDKAAMKLVSLAQAQVLRGLRGPAMTAAERALQISTAVAIRFLAARVFIEAGSPEKAAPLIEDLASEFTVEPQAYAKILEGELALKRGKPRDAVKALTAANELLDTWIGDFDLGRAYLQVDLPVQADGQFDRALKRKGEALSLFADEEPTAGYFPPALYYQGRVREALKNAGFADSYRAYIAIRGKSTEDSLLPDARRLASR